MASSMMAASQVAFEPRDFIHAENYPSMDDHHVAGADGDAFGQSAHQVVTHDLADGVNYNGTGVPDFDATHNDLDLDTSPPPPPPAPRQNNAQATPPPTGNPLQEEDTQTKAPAKPKRVAVKNAEGKFVCTVEDCGEEIKTFGRKCEWNKHMDKHERPYRCLHALCRDLPGFTYAGGLLRHEREVHHKHGGPKKPLMCPHPTCKRYAGKPFSRQENLNEHLRRVHTAEGGDAQPPFADNDHRDTTASAASTPPSGAAKKRKRTDDDASDDVFQENERLRGENTELRQKVHELEAQIQLIAQLQEQMGQATAIGFRNGPML